MESVLLSGPPGRRQELELEKFRRMGPITDQELTVFRRALRRFRGLSEDAPVGE